MSCQEGWSIALTLIAKEAQERTGFLDLGRLGLTTLPAELRTLSHLRLLNLGSHYLDEAGDYQAASHQFSRNNFSESFQLALLPNLERISLRGLILNDLSPLAELKCLHTLDCHSTSVSNLGPLAELKCLKLLDCSSTSVSDLNPLAELKCLRLLYCSSTSVSDLSPLAELKSLRSLDCSFTSVSDLSPLVELKSIRSLDCHCTSVSDISPLAELKSLQSLNCRSTRVRDLSPLAELEKLQSLDCGFTSVRDLSPLAELRRLQSLNCRSTGVGDLSPLVELKNIQSLDCSLTSVGDLSPLAELKKLQSLDCRSTSVSDLSPMAELKKLKSLHCRFTSVSDLSPLVELKKLQSLDCRSTSVSDLSPLAGLKNLKSLYCRSTLVSDLSPLAEMMKLQTLVCNSTSVRDLTPLAKLKNLQTLYCGSTSVRDLSPLAELKSLQRLDCGSTLVSNLSTLAELKCLRSLFCRSTSVSDLSPLAELKDLRSLFCGSTSVSDLSQLAELKNLERFDCSSTRVSDLGPLAKLYNLRSLICGSTSVSDLSPLAELKKLEALNCRSTLVRDLTPLTQMKYLQRLDCGSTSVSDLSPLADLKRLRSLYCRSTSVNDLSPLAELKNLQRLDCGSTPVTDLSPLCELKSLQTLNCWSTSVSDLEPLVGLVNLQRLVMNQCHLTAFPQGLLHRDASFALRLFQATIPGVPAEVLSQNYSDNCFTNLRDHLHDLSAGSESVMDVKVIVLGNGRIGKTQICNRLRGEEFEADAKSTHGITVIRTELALPGESQPMVLNLWDFGGQDLYHGTHALFLKTRSVFVIVWTPTAESTQDYEYGGMRFRNQPLEYWLDYVQNVAGPVCPLVIVQNQCDDPQDEMPLPPVTAELLKGFYWQAVHYSAKENRKRESLNEAMREAVRYLHGREGIATIGKGRWKVRQQLQRWLDEDSRRDLDRRQHRTLTQQQFRELCADVGDVSSPESLLEYLHNAGIVFYQRGVFRDEIVLDQTWALEAIYTVFNREQCFRQLSVLGGRFTRPLLEALVWPLEKYSRAEQQLFLSMMTSCGICFVHRRSDERRQIEAEYVAPDLLPDRASVEAQLVGRWDETAPHTEQAWRFEFLPASLVRSIISEVGSQAGECAVYWKYGVWFYDAVTQASAIIVQELDDDGRQGRIVLRTQGPRGRDLLASVTVLIDQIITRSQSARKCERESRIDPAHAGGLDHRTSSVPDVRIADPPRPAELRQACVSYAWKEERSRYKSRAGKVEEFCTRLNAAGRTIVRDTTHVGLGDRLSTFMRSIGQGDQIYIFLSDAYLKSPNCMYELLIIWQTSGDDPERFRLRTRVLTMPGTDIFSISARLGYAAYWKQQRDAIRKVIDAHGVDVLGQTDLKNFKQIQDFAHHVDEMLAQIADVLQPREFDGFINEAIDELS